MENLSTYAVSEVGSNHIKVGRGCEDASGHYSDEHMSIVVVADGHGSDNYPRTDRGSAYAVEAAMRSLKGFVASADPAQVLRDPEKGFPMLVQLSKNILRNWHVLVEEDYKRNPFTQEELDSVPERYRRRYSSDNPGELQIDKAYGSTLIAFLVTEDYALGLQIGDGKCSVLDSDAHWSQPIPWDDNCEMNVTTSLCDSDAIEEFRFFVSAKRPAAVFLGSDGVDGSYGCPEEMYALFHSIILVYGEHGTEVGDREVGEYLPILTKAGSGDDVSLGEILDMDWVKEKQGILAVRAELQTLEKELEDLKQSRNTAIEKARALKEKYVRPFLTFGRRMNPDRVQEINELEDRVDDLALEIKDLKDKISEKEYALLNLERLADGV